MYVYLVEYLNTRIVFRTEQAAEEYVAMMFGDTCSDGERIIVPRVMPCVMVGE